ncbi:hypothetical protein [Elizabethkingia anophelis]|uniref:hypothetical protein n=1 Tax=Elizabethkingia anophelis TaxID=1117645 RepID=UPI00240703B6|nr:hypothetical protein [Elizabethkingia anophelis]
MAGQGTFVAYQPLRPTELKTGDYVNQMIGDMIKRGDTLRASKLKQNQENGKTYDKLFDNIKLDYINTLPKLQDSVNENITDGISEVANLRLLSANASNNIERQMYFNKAKQVEADVKSMATFLDENTTKSFQKNIEKQQSGKYYEGDKNLIFFEALNTDGLRIVKNENGIRGVWLPENINIPMNSEEKLKFYTLGEVKGRILNGIEDDLTTKLESNLAKFGSKMVFRDKVNKDGNITQEIVGFDEKRANEYLNSELGSDFNKIPREYQQKFEMSEHRDMKDASDIDILKKILMPYMRSSYSNYHSSIQKYTPEQMYKQQLDVIKAQYNATSAAIRAANGSSRGGNNGGSGANVSIMPSNTSSIVQVQDNDGNVIGTRRQNMSTTTLPKVKGMPASNNTFGLSTYVNKKGNQVNAWYLGAPSDDGKSVYSRISETEFNNYVRGLGYNPISVKATLTNSDRELIKQPSGINKNNSIYKNTKISFKSKDLGDDIDL